MLIITYLTPLMCFLTLSILWFSGITEPAKPGQLFMCTCSSERPELGDDDRRIKDKYIYLVRGEDGRACCGNAAIDSVPGFHEKWIIDYEGENDVWKLPANNTNEIPARNAQAMGCQAEAREIAVTDVSKFPEMARKYYPDIVEKR